MADINGLPDGWLLAADPNGSVFVIQLDVVIGMMVNVCDNPECDQPLHYMAFFKDGRHELHLTREHFYALALAKGFTREMFSPAESRLKGPHGRHLHRSEAINR
jgi:hypothetical protein